tara:strand:+ start:3613 stop:3963 length:351 start_codon:yes stop_codon:yes gene_type:complete
MSATEIIGITTVIFGLASLVLVSRARSKLSKGSIRQYMDNFAICLTFIVGFSLWQTIRDILDLDIKFRGLASYPEYFLIILAYVAFIITSYRIIKIGEEFGFKKDAKKIKKIINKE